jgi:hypothetical protein
MPAASRVSHDDWPTTRGAHHRRESPASKRRKNMLVSIAVLAAILIAWALFSVVMTERGFRS